MDGAWQDLDATLVRNPDGTISPKSSSTPLTLSGGGIGPLASLTAGGDALAITLPVNLPAPTLSGNSPTCANVAPGVDLVVTADTLGGFSDTFAVHDAAAANSPQLADLLHATVKGHGVSVTAYRAVSTGASTANTNLAAAGTAPAGKPFTMNVTGVDGIPSTATGVAVDLTTTYETGGGYLEVYPTGSTVAADTALTYQTNYLTSMSADVPLGTGGTITIVPMGSATRVYADISGYYTSDTTGQVYHAVNPTRLVDTRNGIGGGAAAVTGGTTYVISEADTHQITTAPTPTLALMITATQGTNGNALVAYPQNATEPGTLNLSWITGQTIANLALTPTSTAGTVDLTDLDSGGTVQLVVDCSGYFAAG